MCIIRSSEARRADYSSVCKNARLTVNATRDYELIVKRTEEETILVNVHCLSNLYAQTNC